MSKKQTVTLYVDVSPTSDINWDSIVSVSHIIENHYSKPPLIDGWKRYRVQFEVPKHMDEFTRINDGTVQEEMESKDG